MLCWIGYATICMAQLHNWLMGWICPSFEMNELTRGFETVHIYFFQISFRDTIRFHRCYLPRCFCIKKAKMKEVWHEFCKFSPSSWGKQRAVVALRWAFLFSWFCWPFFNLFLMAFPIFQGFFSRNHFLEGCFSFQGHEVMSPPCGRMGDVPPHGRCPPCGSPSHALPLWETLHVEVHEHYHTPYNDRTVKGSSLFVNVLWLKAFLRVGMFLFGVVYHTSIL